MSGLGLDAWWDEPEYKEASVTFRLRGLFIFDKLKQHDAVRFADVMTDLCRDEMRDPEDIGTFEWQTIPAFMGASEEEIKDVQRRMGRRRDEGQGEIESRLGRPVVRLDLFPRRLRQT